MMPRPQSSAAGGAKRLPAALFLVALSTVMFEVLLTRVFSLTIWYHFAFMAISVAMFGMTVGALLVFLRPAAWPQATLDAAMGKSALNFALAMAAAVFLHVYVFMPNAVFLHVHFSLPNPYALPVVLTFAVTAVPFAYGGIFVCLALTRFAPRIGQLYAADLAGAALGCLAVIAALQWLDGLGAVLACATLASLAAILMLPGGQRRGAALACAGLAGATLWSAIHLARYEVAAFPITHAKSIEQSEFDYERWNSFSRIVVTKPNERGSEAMAWSLSAAFRGAIDVPNRWLQIDAGAGTQLLGFDGDLAKVEFLRWDLTNFVHHLRRDARVCVVGAGGGRDILTARLFGQKHVLAVEINPNIMRVVNGRFGEFTGHLDRDPRVTLVNDEARSFLARARRTCDIVQLTFIDTWAATAAGAYVLTENTLYTVEGWKIFLDRLADDGLLAVARGAGPELGRLVALGREALRAAGVERPERHMVLVTNHQARPPLSVARMGMLLVRKTPFPEEEVARIRALAEGLQFEVELEPASAKTRFLRALATGQGVDASAPNRLSYEAPVDDRPFFFNVQRFDVATMLRGWASPVGLLMNLLAAVAALTLACIVVPLALARIPVSRTDGALLAFFAAIGAGFMLIEIAMLQRLIVFLGHPAYSLSVVLFVLLLAGGAGSWISTRVPDERLPARGKAALLLLVAILASAGAATGPLIAAFEASETPLRIAVAAALLAAMGGVMGMAFPLGMRLAMASRPALGPWLWGANGATSVLASVAAVVIAMASGISTSYWSGFACYLVALAAFAWAARRRPA
jgi:hypothetical protein